MSANNACECKDGLIVKEQTIRSTGVNVFTLLASCEKCGKLFSVSCEAVSIKLHAKKKTADIGFIVTDKQAAKELDLP